MLTTNDEDDEVIQRTIDAYREARSAAVDY
jgi:hypothetical protein